MREYGREFCIESVCSSSSLYVLLGSRTIGMSEAYTQAFELENLVLQHGQA